MHNRISALEDEAAGGEEQKSADKSSLKAMQEIVDALTEQKLQLTVQMQELQDKSSRNKVDEARLLELSIENESMKRQLKRTNDENDDLIATVGNLEGKLLAVNSIGEEQQQHFLKLEESTNKLLAIEGKYEAAQETISGLEKDKAHMQAKTRAYKEKIIEIVAKFKKLRASHKATLEVVRDYSMCIPNWQEELRKVGELLGKRQQQQQQTQAKETTPEDDQRVTELTSSVEDLKRQLESNRKIMSQVEAEKLSVIDEKDRFERQFKDLENKVLARKQENSDLLQEMKELNEIMKDRGETISKQQSELSMSKQSCEELRGDLQRIQSILTERDQTICALIEESKTKAGADDVASTSTVSKMDESAEFSEEKYLKLKAMAVKLKKRLEEETKRVKELEAGAEVAGEVTKLEKCLAEARQEAEKNKGFAKKYNMLALEMESYENSMDAQTEKLAQKQRIIKELEQTIEEQQVTISSIKEQVRLVEERSTSEVSHSQGLHDRTEKLSIRVRELEQLRVESQGQIQRAENEIAALTARLEETSAALDNLKKEQNCQQEVVNLEKDKIQSTCSELEVQLRAISKNLTEKTEECDRVSKEYSNYKMRAQSILQQSQSQVNCREKELEDELETVRRLMKSTEQSLTAAQDRSKELEKAHLSLVDEKERSASRFAETLVTLEALRLANQQLQLENKQQLEEQQGSVKSHRLNVDTLTNVFKCQIDELERKLQDKEKLINDLSTSNRLQDAKLETFAKRSSTDEEKMVEMRMNLERQHNVQDDNAFPYQQQQQQRALRKVSSSTGGLMPLEDLLNSNLDDEVDYGAGVVAHTMNPEDEQKIQAKENQIRHLSTLLAEAEQDVAKLNQQNDLLKEEIRRQERSEERDAHINNSEYLKNVIFKVSEINCVAYFN